MPLLLLCGRTAPAGLVWQAGGHRLSLPLQHMHSGLWLFHNVFCAQFSFTGKNLISCICSAAPVLKARCVFCATHTVACRPAQTCLLCMQLEAKTFYTVKSACLQPPCLCKLSAHLCGQQTGRGGGFYSTGRGRKGVPNTVHVAVHVLLVFLQQGLGQPKNRLQERVHYVLM